MFFRWIYLIATTCIVSVVAALSFYVSRISPADYETYRQLIQLGNESTKKTGYVARQEREGVSKTILLSEGSERKIALLKSQSSHLAFMHNQGGAELIEAMQATELIYQELLFLDAHGAPMQLVMHLKADAADYFYQQQKIVGNKVLFSRYLMPGHVLPNLLPDEPIVKGRADHMVLTFKEGLKLQAQHIHVENRS